MALRLVGVVSESVAHSAMVAAAALGVLGLAAGSFAAAGKAAVDFALSEEDAPVANRAGVTGVPEAALPEHVSRSREFELALAHVGTF